MNNGVTDDGVGALASAGCGKQLTSLVLEGMREGVTDTSLHALAAAGCGSRLTKLHLSSEWLCEFSVVV